MTEYINGYALALFNLAKEEKKLIKYKKEAILIIEALEQNPKAIHLFNSKLNDFNQRKELITNAFKKVNNNFLHFLFILANRSKFNLTIVILKKLIKFINQKKQINEGIVYSTKKLTLSQLREIESKTSKMLGIKVILTNKLDVNLIGGIKVEVNNQIIEESVVSRIEQIKNSLLKESEEN